MKFKGEDLALGLESAIFICPKCGKTGGLHSEKDRFYCDCGFEAVYDVYGELTDNAGEKYTVTELDQKQKEALRQKLTDGLEGKVLFEDSVKVERIGADHSLIATEEGCLKAYADHLECGGERLNFEDMEGVAIYSRNVLVLHHEKMEGHLEIKSGISFNALKYLYLYEFIEGKS